MAKPARRQQNRLDKEHRILDAALRVFSRTGYSGASMDAIAEEAGVSKPTLYQYFGAKDRLFLAMMTQERLEMQTVFQGASDQGMVDDLYRFAWRYADLVMRPDFLSLARLIIGEAQRFPEIGHLYQSAGPDQLLQVIMTYLDAQRADNRLTFDDTELAAQDFWGLLLSAPRTQALYQPDNLPDRATLARYVNNGLRVFLRAYSTSIQPDLQTLEALISRSVK